MTTRRGDDHNPATLNSLSPPPLRLGEILVQARVVTDELLQEALARAGEERQRLGETLVAMGAASADDVLKAVAAQQELPYLSAEELPSTPPALKELSPKYLRQYVACPIAVEGTTVTVATADPTNPLLLDDLQQTLRLVYQALRRARPAILEAIERAYGANTAIQKIVEGMGSSADERHRRRRTTSTTSGTWPSRRRSSAWSISSSRRRSPPTPPTSTSSPSRTACACATASTGCSTTRRRPPRRLQAALTSRIKIMAELNIAERRLPQDGRIRVTAPDGRRVDMRVSTVPTIHGECIVMRLLDRSSVFLPFDRLGFSTPTARGLRGADPPAARHHAGHRPHRLGKTTTLYAALDKINRPDLNIITVEDPVEYQLNGINQIQVRPKIGLTFAAGLRPILRQDPDVIMVGEIRDLETAEIAIQAALTGHLVFSTLHTNDAPGAVTRLAGHGLRAVPARLGAQRRPRPAAGAPDLPGLPGARPCPTRPSCSPSASPTPTGVELFRGKGCDECRGTGYRGRTGIYELFRITDEARSLIVRKAPAGELRRHAVEHGMVTLREDAWAKACAGLTTVAEILRVTQEDT